MRILLISSTVLLLVACAVETTPQSEYAESRDHPFGQPNPMAPEAILDFQEMIGVCDCVSLQRNPDGSWQDAVHLVWRFKYILNGTGVQDETWKSDGSTATSIRQFNADSLHWVVSYYSNGTVNQKPPVWTGKRIDDTITLDMPQRAPNGLAGLSRLSFYDITDAGFKWKGEWVDSLQTISYPFWTIECVKRNGQGV
jgi:hypothetical protein